VALYATAADVQVAAGGVKRLLQITDIDGDALEDTGVVDAALDEAEAMINSYARKKFEVPFTTVPEIIKRTAANLAVWVLKRNIDALTEQDSMTHDAQIEWLEGLASGKVDPGVTPSPTASAHNQPSTTDRPTSKAVSRENLKGFS
jgi:phage gp36-like protein